jgi:hypothetical protein
MFKAEGKEEGVPVAVDKQNKKDFPIFLIIGSI